MVLQASGKAVTWYQGDMVKNVGYSALVVMIGSSLERLLHRLYLRQTDGILRVIPLVQR